MVVISSYQRDEILDAVRAMYTQVARRPEQTFHFPTGRAACEFVGYPAAQLDTLPAAVLESFAGVGYPFAADAIRPGDVVLDIGSGSGTDAFLAAAAAGPEGTVYALDMTRAMRDKLEANLRDAGLDNVRVIDGNAESLPLPDASVDVVTSNGVLNLVPNKYAAIAEIERVLRPGGRVQIADIVLGENPPATCDADPQLWAECIVGATQEPAYLDYFRDTGFSGVAVLSHLDYFARSANPETREVARSFGARAMVMRATKPARSAQAEVGDVAAAAPSPDRVFDAGEKGCGELAPLIRTELRAVEPGRVLAVHSRAEGVAPEIEAWCRMAGHEFLGAQADRPTRIYYIRRKRD